MENDGSITWMRFEHEQPDTILYKVGYDHNEEFKKIKAIRSLQQNATSKSSGYTLPKAFSQRPPIWKAKWKIFYSCAKI